MAFLTFAASGDRIVTARQLEVMLAAASLRRKRSTSAPVFGLRHGRMVTVARPDHSEATAKMMVRAPLAVPATA